MFPEELTLDLAGTDEFSLATPSLPRTDPYAPRMFSPTPTNSGGNVKLLLTSAGIKNASIHDALVELLGKPIDKCDARCISTALYPHPHGGSSPGVAVHQRAGPRHSHGRTGLEVHGSARAHRPAEPRRGAHSGPARPETTAMLCACFIRRLVRMEKLGFRARTTFWAKRFWCEGLS